MSIRLAIEHRTVYRDDRPVQLGPHAVTLGPTPHCRTPILAYSLRVAPAEHIVDWQQDPFGNHVARFVFQKPTPELAVIVDLVAETTVPPVTALCVEVRDGHVHLCLPPVGELAHFAELVGVIEGAAAATGVRLVVDGYPLPRDMRPRQFVVAPDPGVIEVNIYHSSSWPEPADGTLTMVQEARRLGLGAEEFPLDGTHTALLAWALVTRFWAEPYAAPLVRWGTELHDCLLLPWCAEVDIRAVIAELNDHGFPFETAWLEPFLEVRFQLIGTVSVHGISVEAGSTSRIPVGSSTSAFRSMQRRRRRRRGARAGSSQSGTPPAGSSSPRSAAADNTLGPSISTAPGRAEREPKPVPGSRRFR